MVSREPFQAPIPTRSQLPVVLAYEDTSGIQLFEVAPFSAQAQGALVEAFIHAVCEAVVVKNSIDSKTWEALGIGL